MTTTLPGSAGPGVDVDGGSGRGAGPAVLPRLVAAEPDLFAEQVWGRTALLSTADRLPAPFTDLLSADAVDELVSRRGLRTPFLRVARNGSTLGDRAFTAPGGVGAGIGDQVSDDKLVALFAEGSTMVLQALHRTWPPVIEFCQALAAELGHPVQANAYVTPPQNQGFNDHYDVHDVFVLQVDGEKRWQIHEPVLPSPLRDQPWSDRRAAVAARAAEPPVIDTVLRPGDCLYLPRGYLHAATALGGVSTHLTLGVHVWTRYTLAERLVQQALRTLAGQPDSRGTLPLGVRLGESDALAPDVEQIRAALLAAIREADVEQLAEGLRRADRDTSRAAPVGPLRQLRTADALTEHATLRLRPHLAAGLDEGPEPTLVLRSRAADFAVAADEAAAIRALLVSGSAPVSELGLPLARRLVLHGLVTG